MKTDYFIGEDIKKDYYRSELLDSLVDGHREVASSDGHLKIYLPLKFGVCHGVARAIRMARYTREKYTDSRIFLLNEIVHNPFVNEELKKEEILFLGGKHKENEFEFTDIRAQDVVIVPAFGGSTQVYQDLTEIGCTVVDTTCGEVMSVWKRIKKYNKEGFTTLIFGKYAHEETIATASRAERYLVMKDLAEVEMVAAYIQRPSAAKKEELNSFFAKASSPEFDPDVDLVRVGMASQTTMYAKEFIQASDIIREAMLKKYGAENINEHFRELDTICSATQERQDAIKDLFDKVDLMIVVGGYNSSNTTNLAKISGQYIPAYHIKEQSHITREGILYQDPLSKEEMLKKDWLPAKKPLRIGVTSGASTVDILLEEVVQKLLSLAESGELYG